MAKQIIRLTESDLHNIIRESVRRVLREQDEYTEADLETAKKKMKALKKKGGPEYLKAAQEWQKIKEKLGKVNVVNQPGADWSEKENEKRNIMTHEKFKHVDPRKRKDIDKDKKPKQSEITKGREQIAKDALKREKELRSIEQGAADTD
jgi:hypothetical protein